MKPVETIHNFCSIWLIWVNVDLFRYSQDFKICYKILSANKRKVDLESTVLLIKTVAIASHLYLVKIIHSVYLSSV